jgi:hypothetical protein
MTPAPHTARRADTTVMVGELDTWVRNAGSADGQAHGAGTTDHGGLPGVYLRNDGVHHYWLGAVGTFRLEYDGEGWLVTNSAFWHWAGRDHYLSDGKLPMRDGSTAVLDTDRVYEIRFGGAVDEPCWELFKVT